VASRRAKYSPEFKEAAVLEVIKNSRPIADVARENGIVAQTLGNWVAAYRSGHAEDEPDLSLSERARLKELERENRELRMENEFLGKATAFFAKRSQ
jgi:transposase-like protein